MTGEMLFRALGAGGSTVLALYAIANSIRDFRNGSYGWAIGEWTIGWFATFVALALMFSETS